MNPYQHLFDDPDELDEQEREQEVRSGNLAPRTWIVDGRVLGGQPLTRADRLRLDEQDT